MIVERALGITIEYPGIDSAGEVVWRTYETIASNVQIGTVEDLEYQNLSRFYVYGELRDVPWANDNDGLGASVSITLNSRTNEHTIIHEASKLYWRFDNSAFVD